MCHKFLVNKCDRSGEDCIFSHKTNIHQDFHQVPPPPLHSPSIGMPNMSIHIQNQQHKNTQVKKASLENIIELIPQIVSQVIQAITIQLNN